MKKTVVLVCFVVALAAAVLVATDRARSMDADDTTPPVGWVSLPVAVPSIHVEVAAAVADPDSGVIELRLSNDGTTWSGWEGYPSASPDGSIQRSLDALARRRRQDGESRGAQRRRADHDLHRATRCCAPRAL